MQKHRNLLSYCLPMLAGMLPFLAAQLASTDDRDRGVKAVWYFPSLLATMALTAVVAYWFPQRAGRVGILAAFSHTLTAVIYAIVTENRTADAPRETPEEFLLGVLLVAVFFAVIAAHTMIAALVGRWQRWREMRRAM